MAKFGHVKGHKRERHGSSEWYRKHESDNLAKIEQELAQKKQATPPIPRKKVA